MIWASSIYKTYNILCCHRIIDPSTTSFHITMCPYSLHVKYSLRRDTAWYFIFFIVYMRFVKRSWRWRETAPRKGGRKKKRKNEVIKPCNPWFLPHYETSEHSIFYIMKTTKLFICILELNTIIKPLKCSVMFLVWYIVLYLWYL